jgi:hypothetical protein
MFYIALKLEKAFPQNYATIKVTKANANLTQMRVL